MNGGAAGRPARRADVEAVDVDGELVLWDPVSRTVHRLDPVGSLLWPFLDGSATVSDLALDASDVFDVPVERAQEALDVLVEQLSEARLLRVAGEPPTSEAARPRHLVDPPSP